MSSSPAKTIRNKRLKTTAIVAAALLLLDFVYNQFSHGIGSWYMHLVPAVVLLAGFAPAFVVARFGEPKPVLIELWRMGLSAVVSAMILSGILEIAGSEARSLAYFVLAGFFLWLTAATLYVVDIAKKGNRR